MTLLTERIRSRAAVVGIIGQGYVGLPLALVFEEAGFAVRGLDVDPKKTEALNRGESYIKHIGSDRVARAVERGRFTATTDFDALRECDAILICVPTPLGQHREPDLSFIHNTARQIASRLRRGPLVVLESTTYPGTTDEEVRRIRESCKQEDTGKDDRLHGCDSPMICLRTLARVGIAAVRAARLRAGVSGSGKCCAQRGRASAYTTHRAQARFMASAQSSCRSGAWARELGW